MDNNFPPAPLPPTEHYYRHCLFQSKFNNYRLSARCKILFHPVNLNDLESEITLATELGKFKSALLLRCGPSRGAPWRCWETKLLKENRVM